MKKLLILMFAAVLSLSLVACGDKSGETEFTDAPTESSYVDITSCAEYAIDQLKSSPQESKQLNCE